MDNMYDIEKRIDKQNTSIVVKEEVKISPVEPDRSYAQMSSPMTKLIATATIDNDTVSDEVTDKIKGEVNKALKDDKFVAKKSRKLAKVGNRLVEEEINAQDNVASHKRAQNKVNKQLIENNLYVAKQEKKRAVKEQRHLNYCQKEKHRQELADYRWQEYGEMLKQYGFNKTPASWIFNTIVFLDGLARFFTGLDKANNKLIKALKFVIIGVIIVGIYHLMKFNII